MFQLFIDTDINAGAGKDVVARLDEANLIGAGACVDECVGTEALVHITCGVVEDTEHRDEAIGLAVGTANDGALGSNVRNVHANAAGVFTNGRAVAEGLVNSLNGVTNTHQETGRELLPRRAGVEEGWGRMSEFLDTHHVVCFKCAGEVHRAPEG